MSRCSGIVLGVVLALVGPVAARADLTGLWDFAFDPNAGGPVTCRFNVVQSGVAVSFVPPYPQGVPAGACPTLSGSLFMGALSGNGSCYFGGMFTLYGSVAPDENSASGNYACGNFPGTFTAARIGCDAVACDDGDPCTEDTCDAQDLCQYAPNTGSCDDGDPCTTGEVCSGGTCGGGSTTACGPCEACVSGSGCTAAPRTLCRRPTASLKATLTLSDRTPNAGDALAWKWTSGDATSKAELGSPSTTTSYDVCVFEGSALRLGARAPAGGTCGSAPCWRETSTGFVYRDPGLDPDGLKGLKLKSGLAGTVSMSAKGAGPNLGMPALPFASPATVQLVNVETGLCWQADHDLVLIGRTDKYKAKGD
jgi:hypothetical protein